LEIKLTVWPVNTTGKKDAKEKDGELSLLGALKANEECVECVLLLDGKEVQRFEVNAEDLENAMRTLRAFTAHQ
jgi:hypothetical protein